jgi:hypothetical protein
MNAQIEHQDFTVLALYLVPRFMVCEARTIADGRIGHGSPPTLEKMESWAIKKPSGEGSSFTHFPKWIDSALTISKLRFKYGETLVIGWSGRIRSENSDAYSVSSRPIQF